MNALGNWINKFSLSTVCITTTLLVVGNTVVAESAAGLTPAEYVREIEDAHQADRYDQQSAIQAEAVIDFGSMRLETTMIFTPSTGMVRLTLADGTDIIFNGRTAWVSPDTAQVPGPPARFHVLTWPYFVAAAYKLNDPGTHLESVPDVPLQGGRSLPGVRVTFDPSVGDTPDDWYVAVKDPETDRLTALAYIVTFGKDKNEAEAKPSIMLYDDFIEVDGVPFATTWTFHHWDAVEGITGEPKGSAMLSNIKFVSADENTFAVPEDAVEAKIPLKE